MMQNYKVVTLCGSTRFKEQFMETQKRLTLDGYHFDYTSNRIILDRSSYDFGIPKWHLLGILKVPSVYRGLRLVYFYDGVGSKGTKFVFYM